MTLPDPNAAGTEPDEQERAIFGNKRGRYIRIEEDNRYEAACDALARAGLAHLEQRVGLVATAVDHNAEVLADRIRTDCGRVAAVAFALSLVAIVFALVALGVAAA